MPSWSPAYPAFSLLSRPHPPTPLPSGKGETISLFCRGLRPRHPGIRPLTALTATAAMVPSGGLPSASPVWRKTVRTAFLLAVPAAKERGDRGRGTSAFEMVLSPGAGITNAARGKPPNAFSTVAGIASAARGLPRAASATLPAVGKFTNCPDFCHVPVIYL